MSSSKLQKAFRLLSYLTCIFIPLSLSRPALAADVTLTWQANSEADLAGYRVFSRADGESYNYSQPEWEGTSTTCTIQDLAPDTTFFFVVRAFDTQGLESDNSNETSHHTPAGEGNQPPTANNQNVSTQEDVAKPITLTATDPDGDSLTYSVVDQPSHGTLSGTAPNLTYTPHLNHNGPDSFTFKANDGTADSNTATVSIAVNGVNDVPVAGNQSISTNEDTPKSGTLVATDVDGDGLTYSLVTNGARGNASITNASAGAFVYTPHANENGTDSFTFKANDGTADSNTATVTMTISAVNDAPTANSDAAGTNEDTPVSIVLTGADVDGDSLTYNVTGQPSNGTLSGTAPNLTYTPDENYNGLDSFTFKANDGSANSNTATVSITVTAQNDTPEAENQNVTTDEDTTVNITLTGSDVDGDSLTYAVVDQPSNGTLSGTAPNLTYTPGPGYVGPDSFTFKANDGTVDSNIAEISLTVSEVNDPPVADGQSVATNEDTALAVTLTASDEEGDSLTYSVVESPSHGALSGTAPNLIYTPNADYNGVDSFTFKANDGTLDSNTAAVTMTVSAVNDAPAADNQSISTNEDGAKTGTLTATDVEGDSLTYVLVSNGTKGTASITNASTGAFTYTPNANENGTDSFSFKVNDGSADSNTATVTVTITAVNDAPTADSGTASTNEDTAVNVTLTGSDIDGDTLTYAVVEAPSNGVLSGTAPDLTYTPEENYNGLDSFTFRVNDGSVNSNTATVSITVTAQNDTPVADDQSLSTDEDVAVAVTLLGSDSDGDTLTYSVVDQPAHGALSGTAPNLTYTPHDNYGGSDSFTFKVSDGTVESSVAAVDITVNAINDPPVAIDDSITTDEDTEASGTLSGTDVEDDGLTFVLVTSGTKGTATITKASKGWFKYTPNSDENGTDTFTFKVNDGAADSDPGSITVSITAVNDTPVAHGGTTATSEDTAAGITLSASDVDGDSLTYFVVDQPSHGALSGTAPNLTYTPDADYIGADSFTFKVNDGTVDSAVATISITVTEQNDPPVADNQGVTTDEDSALAVTLTATDADGDTLTYSVMGPPSHGTLSGATPNLTYTPDANYNGPDSFTFKANDGAVDSNIATVSITVNAVNDVPVAYNHSTSTNEDTAKTGTLSADDADEDGLTYVLVTNGAKGNAAITNASTGAFAYTPDANENGTDTFTFKVNDGSADSNTATVTVTINPVNDSPVANTGSANTNEDTPVNVTLTGSDIDGDTLTYAVVGQPVNGALSGTPPNLTYAPNADYSGSDTFSFRVNDGTVNSNTATVTVTISAVNDAPAANSDTLTTNEDSPVSFTLSASDVDGDTLTYFVVDQPSHGALSGTAPSLTYTPDADYVGADSLTFKVNDGTVDSAVATISFAVNEQNDPPVADNQGVTTDEDSTLAITLTATDADGDSLTYSVAGPPSHGTLSGTGPSLTYTPDTNYNGPDSFTFKVNDGTADSNVATVSITINAVNDAPVAGNQSVNTSEDAAKAGTLSATDAEGDSLTYVLASNGTKGIATITNASTGAFTYTPDANENGTDTFTFKANDGTADSNTATVTVTINAVNDAPIANIDAVTTNEDTPVNVTLTGSDIDGDTLTYAVVQQPANGSLSGTPPSLTYTPNADFSGPDSFSFRVNDGTVNSNTASVSITISAQNDVPVANAQIAATDEDIPVSVTLTGSDADGDSLTYHVMNQPSEGTLSGTPPSLTYTPGSGYVGEDSFTFKVNDGTSDSNIALVSILVNEVNAAPVANNQGAATSEDTAVAITLTATDGDGDTLTYSVVGPPSHGTLSGTAPNLTYGPNLNYYGSDSLTFRVNDGRVDSNIATVSITINAVNDAPVAINQSISTSEDAAKTGTLGATDPEGGGLTFALVSNGSKGTASITNASTGAFTYIPDANVSGTDTFTFKANDGSADSNTATVTITINAVNDAPTAHAATANTNEDTSVNVTLTGSDIDGDTLTYAVVSQPIHGTLSGTAPNLTYGPNANYYGTDSFTFRVHDGKTNSSAASVSITVNGVNDAPIAGNRSFSTQEDVTVGGTLSATDADGDPLTFVLVANGTKGTATITNASSGAFSYVPDPGKTGADTFTFKATDGSANSNTATVTVTIGAVNDAPSANGQTVATHEDSAVSLALTGTDPDGDQLTYHVVSGPSHGTLSGTAPELTYTPKPDFNGPDEFTFKVNDGAVDSSPATVFITVEPQNDAPIASAQSVTTDEDAWVSVTLSAGDADGDSLTYSVAQAPAHGTLSGTAPDLTYSPAPDYNGPDEFTFKVNDGTADSNVAAVSITINAVNDGPVAADLSVTTDEDTAVSGTLSASDADGDGITYLIVTNGAKGTAAVTNAATGTFTYTPEPDENGADSFTYKVNDGTADSNISTVTVTITAVNDAPVAVGAGVTTDEDTPISITLDAGDVDGDGLTYHVVAQPAQGAISGTGPQLTYTPNPDYSGSDSFTFKASDGKADSNVSQMTISINAVNDPPVASAGSDQTTDEENAVTLSGSASADVDDGIASFQWEQTEGPPVALSDAGSAQPSFVAPEVTPSGASLSFLLTVTDRGGLQATDTCTVAVRDVPKPDLDRDGIPDEEESLYGTDPTTFDTDGDGYADGVEKDMATDPLDPESMPATSQKLMAGLGTYPTDGGWIELFGADYASEFWLQVEWPDYNAANGEARLATGDIDGDGKDEIIIGLGPVAGDPAIPGGLFQILDDDYSPLAWGQIEWPDYNEQNGESWPACGDIDGDGDDEVIIGLGAGGGGNVEIFDYVSGELVHLSWATVDWEDYNGASGETRPACGDIDGDGKDEIVIGLGPVPDNADVPGGLFQLLDHDLSHLAWGQIEWPDYNGQNGESWPACGDLDSDGDDEIVIGLGIGGNGNFEVFDFTSGSAIHTAWSETQVEDPESTYEETRPACGNLDEDGRDEILIGLGPGGGGWLQTFDDAAAGFGHMATLRILSDDYNASNGEGRPAIKSHGLKPKQPATCPGDFDFDGDVDGTDLKTFLDDFHNKACDGSCAGDLDGDGDVDSTDMQIFKQNFGRTDCGTM